MKAPFRFTPIPLLALFVAAAAGCASTSATLRPPAHADDTSRQNAAGGLATPLQPTAPDRPTRDFDYLL